jgi:hypothetical protein
MDRKRDLDTAANKLLGVLGRHAQGLPATEVDAKWSAFAKAVAKVETSAKRRGFRKLRGSLDQAESAYSFNKLLLGCQS